MMNRLFFLNFITLLLLYLGCNEEEFSEYKGPLLTELTPEQTGVYFNNQIIETAENHHLVWESIYNGAGVGVGDINNDGLMDIYLGGNMVEDKIYLNQGDFNFEDITSFSGIKESSWTSGINMVDVNQDGWIDIYLNKMSWKRDNVQPELRANKLYLNQGDNSFKEVGAQMGVDDKGHSTQSSFFDYDQDGDLDLYVMNAPSHRYDQKLEYLKKGEIPYEFKDHFYVNEGGTFRDATYEVIGEQDHAYGLGLVTLDLNQDGWTDIYVANDFEKPDLMLINNKQGGFYDAIQEKLRHISYSSMGMDVGDINNDGLFDIAVLDMQSNDHVRSKTNMPSMDIRQFWTNVSKGYHFQYMSNMLQLNNGQGFYSEIAQLAGIASTDWSWSVLFSDLDNDSYQDIIVTNGINRNIKDNDFNTFLEQKKDKKDQDLFALSKQTNVEPITNFAYQNQGDLTFKNVSESWNFAKNGFSFGSAYADLDNDGSLDLIVSNSNAVASIYRNNSNSNNFLRVEVKDKGVQVLNAQIKIVSNGITQIREIHPVRGYQSSSSPIVHFGLGQNELIDSLIITSPGHCKVMTSIKANQTLQIDISESQDKVKIAGKRKKFFVLDENIAGIEYFHVENEYNDFDHQVLIPHMESRNGPCGAVGDLNGDGLEDIYIGAAKNDFGLIYLQTRSGSMVYKPNPIFQMDSNYEDQGASFIDIDNDGDLDLYVSSGGSEYDEGDENYEDRLYINDGQANYRRSDITLPKNNASKVLTLDVNQDGWMDIFVGGRMQGKAYPYAGHAHLLLNKNGKLVADDSFPGQGFGMVTDAAVLDINEDSKMDLVVVGEWMEPTFLINDGRGWKNETNQYLKENLHGWWFSISRGDINGDGKEELIVGNMGLNNKYKASQKKPLKVYAADFNDDKKSDIVLAKDSKYGEVPVRGFECSSEQLPYLREKFASYNSFAHAEIRDLIDTSKAGSLKLTANEFRSGYLQKEGKSYHFIPFSNELQLGPIRSIHVQDINQDQIADLIIGGNLFEAEVETVRHDAWVGKVVLGGKKLIPLSLSESGFYAAGNVRNMVPLEIKGQQSILVLNNNTKPQLFKLNTVD